MSRTGKQALIVVVALSVLSFLVVGSFLGRTAEADSKLDQSVKRVELANGSGDVEIVGSNVNQIEVHQRVRHRFGKPDETFEVKGDTVRLNSDCGWGCHVEYTIRAPKGTEVTGSASSGDVSIHDVAGVDVRLSSGDLEVDNLSGSLRADLGSGGIRAMGIRGNADVHTSSGDIQLSEVTGQTKADTGSGEIEGDLRASTSIDAHAGSGDIELKIANAKSVRTETGSGSVQLEVPDRAYRIDAKTGSGDVAYGDVRRGEDSDYVISAKTGSGDVDFITS